MAEPSSLSSFTFLYGGAPLPTHHDQVPKRTWGRFAFAASHHPIGQLAAEAARTHYIGTFLHDGSRTAPCTATLTAPCTASPTVSTTTTLTATFTAARTASSTATFTAARTASNTASYTTVSTFICVAHRITPHSPSGSWLCPSPCSTMARRVAARFRRASKRCRTSRRRRRRDRCRAAPPEGRGR